MPRTAKGHIEQLPSGSFRVSVYGGIDPLTRQEIHLRFTVKDELQAQIELGRLLKEASEGRTLETGATVATLMDEYAPIAEWDVSTRQTNEGFIRRTIKPALGHLKVRKVRGPILDQLYTRLKRCGDLSCTGTPFTEHRNVPDLTINPHDSHPARFFRLSCQPTGAWPRRSGSPGGSGGEGRRGGGASGPAGRLETCTGSSHRAESVPVSGSA